MAEPQMTVTVDSRMAPIFALVGAIIGLILSLLIGPVVSWLLDRFDSAPLLLRLIDLTPWSIPVLIVLGAIGGWVVFAMWDSDVGRVVVDTRRVKITSDKTSAVFQRDEIAEVFLDKDELVLLNDQALELSRSTSEAGLAPKLEHAFTAFEYPWVGSRDPRDNSYAVWTDRSPELEEAIHALFRKRRRALEDDRLGEAENLREELASHGVVVRDRDGKQQYRLVVSH